MKASLLLPKLFACAFVVFITLGLEGHESILAEAEVLDEAPLHIWSKARLGCTFQEAESAVFSWAESTFPQQQRTLRSSPTLSLCSFLGLEGDKGLRLLHRALSEIAERSGNGKLADLPEDPKGARAFLRNQAPGCELSLDSPFLGEGTKAALMKKWRHLQEGDSPFDYHDFGPAERVDVLGAGFFRIEDRVLAPNRQGIKIVKSSTLTPCAKDDADLFAIECKYVSWHKAIGDWREQKTKKYAPLFYRCDGIWLIAATHRSDGAAVRFRDDPAKAIGSDQIALSLWSAPLARGSVQPGELAKSVEHEAKTGAQLRRFALELLQSWRVSTPAERAGKVLMGWLLSAKVFGAPSWEGTIHPRLVEGGGQDRAAIEGEKLTLSELSQVVSRVLFARVLLSVARDQEELNALYYAVADIDPQYGGDAISSNRACFPESVERLRIAAL
ncbi:MAG: hypothetical protein KDB07_10690, partial [Planctomycetes bacterium]|nr:hypothetical protein [Planctomycetota bacterium]